MRHHPHPWRGPALALVLALAMTASCDGEPAGNTSDCVPMPLPAVAQTRQALDICPVFECGTNSAEVNDLPIGEMHITPGQNTGEVNAWGAQLIDFIAPDGTNDYIIYYDDGQLFARNGPETLAGADLIGSEFVIRNIGTCEDIHVRIHDYDQQESWTTPTHMVDRYVLTYIHPDLQIEVPVCVDAGEVVLSDDAWAVLLGGERYTWGTKVVAATGDDARGWFNLACANNGLYKMKFMGYDPFPSADNTFTTTPNDRQASLKMVTGDYCGTGESFTETGTLLYWINADGWSENSAPPESVIEAYWNKDGAICLSTPRRMDVTLQDVADECATVGKELPLCEDITPTEYVWESRVPAPLPLTP